MSAINCPVCGYEFPIWLDVAPVSCCHEEGRMSPCQWALDRARGEAVRRKVCPDAFDASGCILPGMIGQVIRRCHEAGFNGMTGLPL